MKVSLAYLQNVKYNIGHLVLAWSKQRQGSQKYFSYCEVPKMCKVTLLDIVYVWRTEQVDVWSHAMELCEDKG